MCKADRLSSFWIGACQVFIARTPFPSKITLTKCNIKFPLNTFSDQITICQTSFEIYTSFMSKKSFICLRKIVNNCALKQILLLLLLHQWSKTESVTCNFTKNCTTSVIFQRIWPCVQSSNIEKCIWMAASEDNYFLKTSLNGCFSKAAAKIHIHFKSTNGYTYLHFLLSNHVKEGPIFTDFF